MLSKSKSKQIVKLKYALLIPVVFAMLVFTTNAQTKSVTSSTTITQELTFEQLSKKYYQDFLEMEEQGINIFKEYALELPQKEKYIVSLNEYAKFDAFGKYILNNSVKRKREEGTLDQKDLDMMNNMLSKRKSYQEYLEWKKTDEAKERWENNADDGILRLVVEDLKKMNEDEKKEEQNKRELLLRDDYFNKLIVTDGYISYSIEQPEKEITKLQELVMIDEVEVPYAVIEQPPTFEDCESLQEEEQKKCTSDAIAKHVVQNFNIKLAEDLGLTGRQRINVVFKIDKEGNITGVRSRAPHPKLEEEAIRVIKNLPKMTPGKQKGKAVIVPYSLPIIFEVADKKPKQLGIVMIEEVEVPFAVIDKSPIYPGCDATSSSDELKECFKNSITNFISKEFGKNLPKNIDSELEPRQKILAMFKIDKTGYIESIRVRAKHPELENEAIRVLKALPKMTPGKHKGKTVVVPYSLPIIYELGKKKN